jgi:hypothetical protein
MDPEIIRRNRAHPNGGPDRIASQDRRARDPRARAWWLESVALR